MAARLTMRVLSTQEPRCNTGGIPRAWQIPFRPGPARFAASGALNPALAWATAAQPVSTTRMSCSMSFRVRVVWP